jgi:hypothetical protein
MSPAEGAADVQEGHQPNDQNATADNKSALHANIEVSRKSTCIGAYDDMEKGLSLHSSPSGTHAVGWVPCSQPLLQLCISHQAHDNPYE